MRALILCIVVALPTFAATEAPKVLKPAEAGVGHYIADLSFTDITGKPGTLSDFKANKYTVLAITNTTCPLCKKFTPTLAKLETEFAAKGVAFLYVNPMMTDDIKASPFKGRYVKSDTLAAALGATSTTDVFVLDANRTVVYRGCVDDQYGLGYAHDAPKHEYLKIALTKLLAGGEPEVKATTAPGCALDLKPSTTTTSITYHNRISRIINTSCVECHRTGGVGPFSLATYDDVKANKAMMRKVVDKGTMPPWFATGKGEHSDFVNDRSLTATDKADLLTWLKSDLPVGDVKEAAAVRVFPNTWAIGKPDAVFQLPKPVAIKATGTMAYQMISVETTFTEDKWVQSVEVQPSAKDVVHHVIVHVIPKNAGFAAKLPGGNFRVRAAGDEERQGFFAAYVPGNSYTILPDGQARLLPKGSTLRFQMHYTPNGKATTDQTKLAIRFAPAPPVTEAKVAGIASMRINIPPGEDNYKAVAKMQVPSEVTLTSMMPHMHVRGKACKYELTTPDGKTKTLMDIPHYDFNWQLRYQFAQAVVLPKGSTLTYTAWYDNSDKNPANPDATKTVKWGPQTTDEMMLGYIEYTVDRSKKTDLAKGEEETVKVPDGGYPIPAPFVAAFKQYDKNADGKLDAAEIDAMPEKVKERVLDYIRKNAKG
ncbi:redoxin domain-containing protein [soil metagenome]